MSSLIQQRPAWLKARAQTTAGPSTPQSQAPEPRNSGRDLFYRNVNASFTEERERKKREKAEQKQRKREIKEQKRGKRRSSSTQLSDDEERRSEGETQNQIARHTSTRNTSESPLASSPEPVRFANDGTPTKKRRKMSRGEESAIKTSVEPYADDLDLKKAGKFDSKRAGAPDHTKPRTDTILLSDEETNNKNGTHTAEDSDAEFARLVRRAEARKAREQQENDQKSPSHSAGVDPKPPPPSRPAPEIKSTPSATPTATATQSAPVAPPDQPVLNILVHSQLPNTGPLLFRVYPTQKLRPLREKWCERWGLPKEITTDVFFKWRDFRLYDTTTCASLGIRVDDVTGEVTWKGKGLVEVAGSKDLEMEAWTTELLEAETKKKREEKQKAEEQARLGTAEARPDTGQGEKKKGGFKVTVKAKEQEDWTITVYKDTAFKRLASAYRKVKKISPDREISIMFDGERVEPEKNMEDMDIEDMEVLEAHIK